MARTAMANPVFSFVREERENVMVVVSSVTRSGIERLNVGRAVLGRGSKA
jgi:hypothetical protein